MFVAQASIGCQYWGEVYWPKKDRGFHAFQINLAPSKSSTGYDSAMRYLLVFCFYLSIFAQQPQKSSDQAQQNEEGNCCCTTYDTNVCLSKVEDKVDRELNFVYQNALKRWNDDPENQELRNAERAWITYRDATCKAESDLYKGGTIMPSIEMRCVLRLTRRRIADIKDAYLFER